MYVLAQARHLLTTYQLHLGAKLLGSTIHKYSRHPWTSTDAYVNTANIVPLAQDEYRLQEHEQILGSVPRLARPLLEPHLLELEARLQPGTLYLTWASMNIDGYLHYAQKVLQRLLPFTTERRCSPLTVPASMMQATSAMHHTSTCAYSKDTQVGICTSWKVQGFGCDNEG